MLTKTFKSSSSVNVSIYKPKQK